MTQPSNHNSDHSKTKIWNDAGYQLAPSNAASSVLANANDVCIRDSTFSIMTNVNTASKPTLDVLHQCVAPNAILNEGGRADDAKCHPGTREEVIGLIERWMNAAESNRLLWLSGPAGGGKTAIMKTIIERSAKRGIQTVNFFFFRGDSTRNGARSVVPTLLYQLLQLYPQSAHAIAKTFSTHPRIIDTSVAEQCKLISILCPIIRQSLPSGRPIVILVDGLDECDVEADRSQINVLRALEGLVKEDDSPFRLLVASRPEAHIKMAFNRLPSHAQTIFLDEQYSPEKDIRLFVVDEFAMIKASHPSAGSLSRDWPSVSDVEEIVRKASGQFIYAATVMRYIDHVSTVPSLSLERVKGIVPPVNNSPFTHLDSIYLFILAQANDADVMHDMLCMVLLQQTHYMDMSVKDLLRIYDCRYNQARLESCVTELSALVQFTAKGNLQTYHASLPDFLVDEARSGIYWVDVDEFRAKVLLAEWKMPVIKLRGSPYRNLQELLFDNLPKPTPDITHALLNLPFSDWTMERELFSAAEGIVGAFFMRAIQRLYYRDDVKVYKRILRRYISMLVSRNLQPDMDSEVPYAKQYLLFYHRWNWWFKFLHVIGRKR